MIKKSLDAWKKLMQILNAEQKRLFWLVLFAAIIAAIFETLGVSVIVPVVNALLTPEVLFEYKWMKPVISIFNIDSNREMIITVIGGTIVLYLVKNGYTILFSWIKAKYSSKIQRECSVYMMQSYMNRGYDYFLNKNSNEIVQGTVNDIQGIYNMINSIIYLFTKVLICVLIGLFMLLSDPVMAISMMISAVVCLLILVIGFKKPMRKTGELLRMYSINANQVLLQAIHGVKEVIVARKQNEFIDQYKEQMALRQKQDIKKVVATDAPNSIVEAFCITVLMVVLCVKVLISPDSTQFIAVLATFAVGAFRILPAIGYISSSFNNIISTMPSLNAVYENIIESREYNNKFYNISVQDKEEYKDHKFSDGIKVDNITFSYSPELHNVLEDLSLEIEKNRSVALVGESGSGKTTLADIILGVLPMNSGTVKLDGIDVKDIPNYWARLIGFVPQSIYLCDSSIAENVAFGVRKKDIDYEQVKSALRMADILDFVEQLPEGLDTRVGDRGVRLSGGQRQRIGIARALYHSPEILVMDEATSALDNDTEKQVMEAIESLQGNITMLIIAHRLTTVKNCDKIYEIKDGKAHLRKYEDII